DDTAGVATGGFEAGGAGATLFPAGEESFTEKSFCAPLAVCVGKGVASGSDFDLPWNKFNGLSLAKKPRLSAGGFAVSTLAGSGLLCWGGVGGADGADGCTSSAGLTTGRSARWTVS